MCLCFDDESLEAKSHFLAVQFFRTCVYSRFETSIIDVIGLDVLGVFEPIHNRTRSWRFLVKWNADTDF